MVQWLRLSLPTQGVWVPSLVEELNPTWLVAKKKKKKNPNPKPKSRSNIVTKSIKTSKKRYTLKKKV